MRTCLPLTNHLFSWRDGISRPLFPSMIRALSNSHWVGPFDNQGEGSKYDEVENEQNNPCLKVADFVGNFLPAIPNLFEQFHKEARNYSSQDTIRQFLTAKTRRTPR